MPFDPFWKPTALAIALLLTPVVLHAQEIGGVSLNLGEQEGVTLKKLSSFVLSGTSEYRWVADTTGSEKTYLGLIHFKAGRLDAVDRYWKANSASPAGSVQQAMAALGQLAGDQQCRVMSNHFNATQSGVASTVPTDMLAIVCGAHGVTVTVAQRDGQLQWDVTEAWAIK